MRYLLFMLCLILTIRCNNDSAVNTQDYPPEIGNIIITQCATSGCHDSKSAVNAEGVDLSSWTSMMNGRDLGPTVIPYSHAQSLLFLYINTYSDLGVGLLPTMPKNLSPLTRDQVLKIRYWINDGAPNKDGLVKWSDNQQRRKYYIANSGCDVVASIDPVSSLVMRYIDVGHVFEIEKPSEIKIAPDGNHWYVCFENSDILQAFNTNTDLKTGQLIIGTGRWTSLCISSNSKIAYLINSDSIQSELAIVDLETMSLIKKYNNLFAQAIHPSLDEQNQILYVGSAKGNFFYKINVADPMQLKVDLIPVNPNTTADPNGIDNPSDLFLSPSTNKLYINCTGTGLFCEYDTKTNQLIRQVFAGNSPQKIMYDPSYNHFFIACTDDTTTLPGNHGFISVIDPVSFKVIQRITTDVQPFGLAIDPLLSLLIVTNRNSITTGPPPHHRVNCEGRVGTYNAIKLNNFELKSEEGYYLSVDPVSVVVRN